MKSFKLFGDHQSYESWLESDDSIEPSLSYCRNQNECHFLKYTFPSLTLQFNVPNTLINENTNNANIALFKIKENVNNINKITIDGKKINLNTLDYYGDYDDVMIYFTPISEGTHTINYYFIDNDVINNQLNIGGYGYPAIDIKDGIPQRSSHVTISNDITTLETGAFLQFEAIENWVISDNLTYIENNAFPCLENVHMNEEIMNRITTLNSSAFAECK